jgi:hypothetical protein
MTATTPEDFLRPLRSFDEVYPERSMAFTATG